MLGLEGYASSEDEIEKSAENSGTPKANSGRNAKSTANDERTGHSSAAVHRTSVPPPNRDLEIGHATETLEFAQNAGPLAAQTENDAEDAVSSGATSPYSRHRQMVQSLTLPPIPNVSIPPSPPGSPGPETTAKTERFLSLKAQGVHFNDKLASNPNLRNPSLLSKLTRFAGVDEEAAQTCSLAEDLQVGGPGGSSFDGWAYVESISEEIEARANARRKHRAGVEFTGEKGKTTFNESRA